MKTIRYLPLALILGVALMGSGRAEKVMYVSPAGSDRGAGTIDSPLATPEGARDAIRALKKGKGLPDGGVIVFLRAGRYELRRTFELTAGDSGEKGKPVAYRAYPGEEVRIVGGREVKGFHPVTDREVLDRLPEESRKRVLMADLGDQGIENYGELTVRGFGQPVRPSHMELFFQDRPMILARWPNEGYARIADLPEGKDSRTFGYSGDRPLRWKGESDPWVYGYWYHDWADTYMKVESLDAERRTITTATRHGYGLRKGNRWHGLNLLAELDSPGEYYIDRDRGVLYFWPPAPLEGERAVVSMAEQLINLKDTRHVTIRGLILECCRGTAVTVSGGDHNRILGCTIRNTGNRAASISGADNRVMGCEMYETGDGGISISGGRRETLTPARLLAENNHIYNYSRWCHTYRPALGIGGCGNIARNNLIHHGPHNAIQLSGNDHLIELNEIHHVCQDTGDVGAFYMGRDWTARGTAIRHNYWHHISGPGRIGAMGVYLDDQASGITISGNIFYKVTRAVFIGGGCDNLVENNIFVDCKPSVHIDARGLGWQKAATDDPRGTLRTRLRSMPYQDELWRGRYPHLVNILEDDPGTPKRNRIVRNISVGGKWEDIHGGTRKFQVIQDNLLQGDPQFVNPENLDFRLKSTSPAFQIGFQPIPVDRIGLYEDERRAAGGMGLDGWRGRALVLLDAGEGFDADGIKTQDSRISLLKGRGGNFLQVETGTRSPWPGITLRAPGGRWDLSSHSVLLLDLRNPGDKPTTIFCRADNPGADGEKNCVTRFLSLQPGKSGTLRIPIPQKLLGGDPGFIGMRGNPPVSTQLDPRNVTELVIFLSRPEKKQVFAVGGIRAAGPLSTGTAPISRENFFPMIDELGQYVHRDWPGKTHSLQELRAQIQEEERDLADHPGPAERTQYGGWAEGPRLEATGFFRVEKYLGKWWLVDPGGRLFWSHGIDCVRSQNATPITDREHYYRNLPGTEDPLARYFGSGSWAPHGYYRDHAPYRTYDFSRANFFRKYGENWEELFSDVTHRRLKSWGMNTIANWSDPAIYGQGRTAYVCTINTSGRKIEGSSGYWGKFPDVFDSSFREGLASRLAGEKGKAAGDPWCIGFFVDNELSWGSEVSLALSALKSPPDQPAKKAFLADLQARYGSIEALNTAWGSRHGSWEDLLASRDAPDEKRARADLTAFYTRTAETYFKTIREELRKVAPDQLYLGCRFAWVNDRAARAAAKFCDVVSYNRYSYSVADHGLPEGIDMPSIIGEFHFGALDRGMFHTGLRKADDQVHRARLYAEYVRGALANPCIIGTHWFQYKDQATTGRGDGENYQIGFIDICDRPYPEIVRASREVGYGMYQYRLRAR